MRTSFKISIAIILLFSFSLTAFGGDCFPNSVIYLNENTGERMHVSCNSFLLKSANRPFQTSSLKKLKEYHFGDINDICNGVDISDMKKLQFRDFSYVDQSIIMVNGIIKIVLYLLYIVLYFLPIALFIFAYKKTKRPIFKIGLIILLMAIYCGVFLRIIPIILIKSFDIC